MIPAPADVLKGAAGKEKKQRGDEVLDGGKHAAEMCVYLATSHTVKTKHARPETSTDWHFEGAHASTHTHIQSKADFFC